MKHLLAVCWEMPPLSGPRAVQVTRTLSALPAHGWSSRVICFGPRSKRYNQDYLVSLEALSGGRASLVPVPSPEESFFFRALWRVAPPLKRFPDEKRVWMPAALRAARKELAAVRPDAIVSFAQPWTDHLIGLQLRRETGLPWIAHFSDPWVDSPYFPHDGLVLRRAAAWERDVIGQATRVIFVNAHARERVMAKYPASWKNKADVIPQTFEGTVAPSRPSGAGAMRLIYTGRFYDGIRTPDALLAALAACHRETPLTGRLHLEFVGGDMARYANDATRLGLDGLVLFTGRVSPAEARDRALLADVLVVIDAPGPDGSLFLPSKLVDYLPIRRPILGITPRVGPSADLIRELSYKVVEPGDVDAITGAIRALLALHDAGRLVPSLQHDSVAERFTIAKTTRTFAMSLEQAVAPRKSWALRSSR